MLGPVLCCCVRGHQDGSKGEVEETSCCSCQQHHDSDLPQQTAPHQPAPFCPCKQHQQVPVILTSVSVEALQLALQELTQQFDLMLVMCPQHICPFSISHIQHISPHHYLADETLRAGIVMLC
jgi:hypothetical protein